MMSYEPLFKTMRQKGITSYRLQIMGFNRATYYSIKKGKSVSTNTIHQLCELLDCPVQDVIEYVADGSEITADCEPYTAPVKAEVMIDGDLMQDTQALLHELGINLDTAVNLFLRQAVRENAIPFRVGEPAAE